MLAPNPLHDPVTNRLDSILRLKSTSLPPDLTRRFKQTLSEREDVIATADILSAQGYHSEAHRLRHRTPAREFHQNTYFGSIETHHPLASFCDFHRLCPTCARRAKRDTLNCYLPRVELIQAHLVEGYHWLLISLTSGEERISTSARQVSKGVSHLMREFLGGRRLKQTASLRSIEVGSEGKVHVHMLYYGPYIDKGELSRRWEKETGYNIVDVKKAKGEPRNFLPSIVHYMMKFEDITPERRVEIWRELKGRRLTQCSGLLREDVLSRYLARPAA